MYSNKKAVTALKQARRKFAVLDDELTATSKNINAAIAEETKQRIADNYSAFLSGVSDNQNRKDVVIYTENLGDRYTVGMRGHQVIYDEFGTGDNGAMSPHPDKDKYNLDPYNSGQTIKTNSYGVHYWIFNGKVNFGVRSGHFMYDAFSEVADNVARNIASSEVIDTAKKVMK